MDNIPTVLKGFGGGALAALIVDYVHKKNDDDLEIYDDTLLTNQVLSLQETLSNLETPKTEEEIISIINSLLLVKYGIIKDEEVNSFSLGDTEKLFDAHIKSINSDDLLTITAASLILSGTVKIDTEKAIQFLSDQANIAIFTNNNVDNMLTIRRYGDYHTVLRIAAPPQGDASNSKEATLSLVVGDEPNVCTVDVFNNDYDNEQVVGLRQIVSGDKDLKPFTISTKEGGNEVEDIIHIDPNLNNMTLFGKKVAGTYFSLPSTKVGVTVNGVDWEEYQFKVYHLPVEGKCELRIQISSSLDIDKNLFGAEANCGYSTPYIYKEIKANIFLNNVCEFISADIFDAKIRASIHGYNTKSELGYYTMGVRVKDAYSCYVSTRYKSEYFTDDN